MRAATLIVLCSSLVHAQIPSEQGPPLHRIVHKSTAFVRVNPLGLGYDGRFSYRLRLYESDSKALRDNFVGIGVAPTVSPVFLRVGPYVEFNPVSVFGLWATLQFVQYFGTFDLLQGYPGAQSVFSDSAIKANSANRLTASGWELTLGANLQFKVGPVLVRSLARVVNGNLSLRSGDTVHYDQLYDVLAPNRGWLLTNDLDVVYQGLGNRLIAGARYSFIAPFYDSTRHVDPPGRERDGRQLDAPCGALRRLHVQDRRWREVQHPDGVSPRAVVGEAPLAYRR
jgi:hypothetical protein